MLTHRYRLPLALFVTAMAAGGATLMLRPRAGQVRPTSASAGDYFTAQQLQRARDFRAPMRVFGLGSMALEGAALVQLVLNPPPLLERLSRRPLLGAAAAGAIFTAGATALRLPLAVAGEQHSRNFGLSTQRWGGWTSDLAKATAISSVISAGGATAAVALMRRSPERWWMPGAAAVVGVSTLFTFIAPVVIDPIFNKFEPLPEGPLRREVLELAEGAGVEVGEVYRVDASRRTTASNAYVWGLGRTKRVVVYDTLIRDFPEDQVRSVIAHELSHVVARDVQRGLLWLAVVAPAGVFLAKELAERLSGGRELGSPQGLPALAMAAGLASTVLGAAGNVLSRGVERRADQFALDLTRDPDAFIGLTRSLAVSNVADPSTPRVFQLLFGTHPTTLERIGAGLQWASAQASTSGNGP